MRGDEGRGREGKAGVSKEDAGSEGCWRKVFFFFFFFFFFFLNVAKLYSSFYPLVYHGLYFL